MYPELLRIGRLAIYSYGFMLGMSLLSAVWLSYRQAPREGVDPQITLDFSLAIVVAGVVGSRLVFVLLNWEYYASNPVSILGIGEGGLAGLSIHGGLLGGIIAGWFMCARHGLRFPVMADLYARPLAMGHTLGRIGCVLRGCCFGELTGGGWGVRTVYAWGLRHPSQLYESGLALLLFVGLTWYMKRPRAAGQLFLLYAGGYAVARFLADLYRESDLVTGSLNLAQLVSLGVLCIVVPLWFRLGAGSRAGASRGPRT
ncbi:MAG: prolipoprotein diacylglyceryl transferase [Bacillota bacterium]|nr:prolipoprotein diacylglyceryl transferase [Bacillota bacterium]